MRVLITGINGFVGRHLEAMFHHRGFDIGGVVRANRRAVFDSTTLHVVDDLASADFSDITVGYDCVVHLAALVHQTQQKDAQAYMTFNHDLTLKLAEAAINNGVKTFFFISTAHVYAGNKTSINEGRRIGTMTPYAQSKYAATMGLIDLFAEKPQSLYILRPPLIYGAGVKGNVESLGALLSMLPFSPFGRAHKQRSYVSVNNFCSFICYLLKSNVTPGIYNISDNHDLSTRELCEWIASAQNRKIRHVPIPRRLMKMAFSVLGRSDHYNKIYGEFRLNIDKALATGWKPEAITVEDFVL
jgi:UDP-glucose 4-epimerase